MSSPQPSLHTCGSSRSVTTPPKPSTLATSFHLSPACQILRASLRSYQTSLLISSATTGSHSHHSLPKHACPHNIHQVSFHSHLSSRTHLSTHQPVFSLYRLQSFLARSPLLVHSPPIPPLLHAPPLSSPVVCEELPSFDCTFHKGCWISWGPCQSVDDGFYSPAGASQQIECPSIPEDQVYVSGDADRTCVSVCVHPDKTRDVNGVCQYIPPGFVRDKACATAEVIKSCERREGVVFTTHNSCASHAFAAGVGVEVVVPPMAGFSIQTWVVVNTRSFVPEQVVPVFGVFGHMFVGIVSNPDIRFDRLVLTVFGNSVSVFKSDFIPKLSTGWNHIAVSVDSEGGIVFYLNGAEVGPEASTNVTTTVESSVSFLIPSMLTEGVAEQYLGMVGRIHYGPIYMMSSELSESVIGENVFGVYVMEGGFPELQLFAPEIVNQPLQQADTGYYSAQRAQLFGEAEASSLLLPAYPSSSQISSLCSGNICLANPLACYSECIGEFVWNPFICGCVSFASTTPSTSTTEQPCVSDSSAAVVTNAFNADSTIHTTTTVPRGEYTRTTFNSDTSFVLSGAVASTSRQSTSGATVTTTRPVIPVTGTSTITSAIPVTPVTSTTPIVSTTTPTPAETTTSMTTVYTTSPPSYFVSTKDGFEPVSVPSTTAMTSLTMSSVPCTTTSTTTTAPTTTRNISTLKAVVVAVSVMLTVIPLAAIIVIRVVRARRRVSPVAGIGPTSSAEIHAISNSYEPSYVPYVDWY